MGHAQRDTIRVQKTTGDHAGRARKEPRGGESKGKGRSRRVERVDNVEARACGATHTARARVRITHGLPCTQARPRTLHASVPHLRASPGPPARRARTRPCARARPCAQLPQTTDDSKQRGT